jgi:hypothetical protein
MERRRGNFSEKLLGAILSRWIRSALILILGASVGAWSAQQPADVKVTQKYLVPMCLDGAPVKSGDRRWKLSPAEHSMTFTMRNKPRKGMVATPGGPGIVVIKFTPEAGHKYELEARASSTTFSTRVWERGAWSPVVRDRTADRVVATEPVWVDAGCRP